MLKCKFATFLYLETGTFSTGCDCMLMVVYRQLWY